MKTLLLPLFNGALETALNRLLLQNSVLTRKFQPLGGKTLQLTISELASVYLLFTPDRLELLGDYEGTVDSHLSLSLSALGLLRNKGQLMQYIREGHIDLQGDPQPWQDLAAVLKDAQWDVEEMLVPYTGDVLAHLVCRHGRELGQDLHHRALGIRQHLGEYVREEARLAVGPLELADFSDDVGELNKRLIRLQGRLAALTDKVAHS